ncbi:MAG: pyruvate kinase [Luteitalea sp.]|nr:pyruvate kinase [Luteitalea sp.]
MSTQAKNGQIRRTKIIATLGPACAEDRKLQSLIAAGVDVFRLNFSHGTREEHAQVLARLRAATTDACRQVATLQDLGGPKIRTGRLKDGRPIDLHEGDRLLVVTGNQEGEPGRVFTSYLGLAQSVGPSDRLLLADGRIELRVDNSDGQTIVTTVITGGVLGQHKGINAPGIRLPASAFTPKDEEDLRFGLAHGVDLVALSFVQSAEDLHRARECIRGEGIEGVPIVAKVERPQAVANLESILAAADAVMVARGDLGLELPLEQVPRVQKEITRRAQARGVPVIVATQVLESMHSVPRPTRAEVSDAANAVDDSVDAIMLSGETAVGAYPVESVRVLDAIIRDAEGLPTDVPVNVGPEVINIAHSRAICEAAARLATSGQAAAIVAVTRAGKTARVLSAYRPPVPIYAVARSCALARRLALYRGVVPLAIEENVGADPSGLAIERHLVERGILQPGAVILFVSVSADLMRGDANFLRIRKVGDPPGDAR